jgi:hypothetical protein
MQSIQEKLNESNNEEFKKISACSNCKAISKIIIYIIWVFFFPNMGFYSQ